MFTLPFNGMSQLLRRVAAVPSCQGRESRGKRAEEKGGGESPQETTKEYKKKDSQ